MFRTPKMTALRSNQVMLWNITNAPPRANALRTPYQMGLTAFWGEIEGSVTL